METGSDSIIYNLLCVQNTAYKLSNNHDIQAELAVETSCCCP